MKITNNFITYNETAFKIWHYSGKDYNDYGRYHECVEQPDYNYILGIINSDLNLPNPLMWGLCLPNVCKAADINEFKGFLVGLFNENMGSIFAYVKNMRYKDL